MSQKRFSFNDGINFLEEGWDKFLFSGSSNGFLMTRPKGKSNLQMYNEASEAWNKKRAEYVDLQNKETKTAIKMKEAMDKLLEKKKKYENIKHIPHLSDTCKTHISDLYTVYTTGRTEDIISKYMDKGIMIEEDIITNYAILKRSMFKKNTVRKKK